MTFAKKQQGNEHTTSLFNMNTNTSTSTDRKRNTNTNTSTYRKKYKYKYKYIYIEREIKIQVKIEIHKFVSASLLHSVPPAFLSPQDLDWQTGELHQVIICIESQRNLKKMTIWEGLE